MDYWIWLIVLGLFIIAEAATTQLVTIWFALGSLAALIVSLINKDLLWLQLTLFVVVSALALILTRPLVKKFRKTSTTATNADRVIGMLAIVTEDVINSIGKGSVTVNGTPWTARSSDGCDIHAGETVLIEKIEGVKLIVSLANASNNQSC